MKKAARNKKSSFFQEVKEEVVEQVKEEKKMANPLKKILSRRSFQIGTFILCSLVLVAVFVGYNYLQNGKNAVGSDGKLTSSQIKNLIDEVGEKIVLPKGETPTIATVTDVSKLEKQPFFRNAQNGDKVMIFGSTKEAILYRPSIHKIISVAPINAAANPTGTPAPQTVSTTVTPSVSPTPTKEAEKLKVVVLNSTKTVGLAKKAADLLDKDTTEILSTANAQGEYEKTTITSVSKDRKISDTELRALVSVFSKIKPTVSSLPSGEAAPAGADVVIILGKDFSENY